MWSTAYGLIALAALAFVVLYAVAHAPAVATVNLADQLYDAKSQLAKNLPTLPRTEDPAYFTRYVNTVFAKVLYRGFPIAAPLGYNLRIERRDILYQLYIYIINCRRTAAPYGEPYVLYEVWLSHSLDPLPWLEVYAAVPRNSTEYYNRLYSLYKAWGRPPAVGLDPIVGADAELVELVRVEHALLYDATSGAAKLYATAPVSAVYILVVDYPLAVPLACIN